MPSNRREFEFRIKAFTLHTIPMSRLAEYLADLAALLGEQKSVHFVRLKAGSVNIVHSIEPEAEPKVRARIRTAKSDDWTNEATRAVRAIDKRLAEDNASGALVGPGGKNIIKFPGKDRFSEPLYGPFNQPGFVEGIPICIGGKNDPVPIHLEEPGHQAQVCAASRGLALRIAPYIFTAIIRAEGIGRWRRDCDGVWIRDKFTIQDFRVLDRTPLTDSVQQLRAASKGIGELENPLETIQSLRNGEQVTH